jgi:hypothetical protein
MNDRQMSTNPEVCFECGLTLSAGGECTTSNCPGPDEADA